MLCVLMCVYEKGETKETDELPVFQFSFIT